MDWSFIVPVFEESLENFSPLFPVRTTAQIGRQVAS